jgi:predicted MPP superfamily phosphohydrolase
MNHDPEKAFSGVPSDATTVVLSHDPQSADFLHRYEPALILSGHTHGGQIFVKGVTPYLMKKLGKARYLNGFFEVNGSVLFVNRGLGATVPIRFRMPSEVAVLTLQSAHEQTDSLAA